MSQTSQAQGYAQAVHALALEGWQNALTVVHEKLAASSDVLAQLNDPQTSFAERQQQLDSLLPDDVTEQIRKFFYTLLQNGDLGLLGEVTSGLNRLATQGPGIQVATVTTAVALSDAEKAQFQQKLSAKAGESLDVVFAVNASIIGGAIVQIGDQIIDGSVASKLNAVQDRLSLI